MTTNRYKHSSLQNDGKDTNEDACHDLSEGGACGRNCNGKDQQAEKQHVLNGHQKGFAYWNRTVFDEETGGIGQPTGRFYGMILTELTDSGEDHDNP